MKRNAYTCQGCNGTIITVDRDEGTTPFMLGCRATVECPGMMQSHFYRGSVVDSAAPATFEWRKPTKDEYKQATPAMRQHFDWGGLDIYPVDTTVTKA